MFKIDIKLNKKLITIVALLNFLFLAAFVFGDKISAFYYSDTDFIFGILFFVVFVSVLIAMISGNFINTAIFMNVFLTLGNMLVMYTNYILTGNVFLSKHSSGFVDHFSNLKTILVYSMYMGVVLIPVFFYFISRDIKERKK